MKFKLDRIIKMRIDKILYLINEYDVKYSVDYYGVHIRYVDGDFIFYLENPMTGDKYDQILTPVYDTKEVRKSKIIEIEKNGKIK